MLDITRLFFRQTCTNNDDEDNQNMALTQIVGVIDALSRLNSQSTFVIDFASHALVYKSKHLLYIDEASSADCQRECVNPYWALMADDVLEKYICVVDNYLLAGKDLSCEEYSNHVCVFDYPIIIRGHKLYITQKFTPIALRSDGAVRLGMYTICHSNKAEINCFIITQTNKRYRFDFSEGRFVDIGLITLSSVEKAILHRAKMGMTNEEIAQNLYISVNTVKTHRMRIFRKLHVETITEALTVVANYHLL